MPDSNEERENFRQEMLKKEEDLKQKFSTMRTEISEKEAIITKEQETLMARAQGREEGEKDLQARKLEVENRESSVKDLEKHLTSALEKATAEQRAFEETSSSKLNQLQDKEKVITEKINDLRALESDDSRMEAILVLKQTIAEKEKVVRDKDRVIAKLEKELHASTATMRETVDALVDKAAEGLVKEMNKKEEKIEKREELVSAQSNRVEAEKAKIHDLARAEKALKEADNKLKRANELVAMNTKREEELLALAKQLDRERTAGAGKNKDGANVEDLDKMATAYDHRISALSKQIKDLKDNEIKLLAKIQRLEKSSRGTPSSTPSNTLGGRKTGLANWSWSLQDQFADPENPTKEELRNQVYDL
jgi:DNA repair exonuclease SbcCD ATPase subunit